MCSSDLDSKTFTNYSKEDGLPNNSIEGILEDGQGNLWLSTYNGISRFTPFLEKEHGGIFRNYNVTDGLQSKQFAIGAAVKSRDGKMYFGGINGFNVFNPDSVKDNQYSPPVMIIDFQIFNKSVAIGEKIENRVILKKSILETEEIELSYKEDVFSFKFVGIDYFSPEKVEYAYKMEGFEKEWNYIGNRRFATYTSLPSGEYMFHVKASNGDGVWNEEGVSIKIKISPPWWETRIFYVVSSILLILGIYTFIIYREKRLKHDNLVLEQKVIDRTNDLYEVNIQLEENQEEVIVRNEALNDKNIVLSETLNELKETQQQLVESEKMASLGILTAGIAHEINNPVNFIYTGVNSLRKDFNDIDVVLKEVKKLKPGMENLNQQIEKIQRLKEAYYFDDSYNAVYETIDDIQIGSERTTEIIKGLRNFSRADKGEWVLTDIHESIGAALILLKHEYKNNIEIVEDYEEGMPKIECNPGKINQVILNLISNAIDAISEKGWIKIRTKKLGDFIHLYIEDNGSGITEEIKTHIFEPFFTSKDFGKGVGLGLSISYGIIKEHNGEIDMETKAGEGTKFSIKLPIKQPIE